jgi:hypothetical protein
MKHKSLLPSLLTLLLTCLTAQAPCPKAQTLYNAYARPSVGVRVEAVAR